MKKYRPLVLALAAKTEVSPAAAAAAASLPAQVEAEPPLMSGLGKLGYRVTTASAPAPRYFDQGLRLAWGFNHDEARRAMSSATASPGRRTTAGRSTGSPRPMRGRA